MQPDTQSAHTAHAAPAIVETYLLHGPSLDKLRTMNLNDCVEALRNSDLLSATTAALNMVVAQCKLRHPVAVDVPGASDTQTPNNEQTPGAKRKRDQTDNAPNPTDQDEPHKPMTVREFVVAFLIQVHPHKVFDNIGDVERGVIRQAKATVGLFSALCKAIASSPRPFEWANIDHKLTENIVTSLNTFVQIFREWKGPDAIKLGNRIRNALEALYRSRALLHCDNSDQTISSNLATEIDANIVSLRAKLAQICGTDALSDFDEQVVPNISKPNATALAQTTAAIPAVTVSPLNMSMRRKITNEDIAHELLLDPGFQFTASGTNISQNPLLDQITFFFSESFWKSIQSDLELESPCYTRVFRLLVEFQTKLVSLTPPTQVDQIKTLINVERVRQEVSTKTFMWTNCQMLIINMVAAAELVLNFSDSTVSRADVNTAIAQMAEVCENSKKPASFTDTLRKALEYVNALQVKRANIKLADIAPVIREFGVVYEKSKFQEKLNAGTITLFKTSDWLCAAIKQGIETRAIERIEQQPKRFLTTYRKVCNVAIMHLITSTETLSAIACPETLIMDLYRISTFHVKFHNMVTSCVMYITADDFMCKAKIENRRQALALIDEYISEDAIETAATYTKNIDAICTALCEHTIQSDSLALTLKNAISRNIAPDSPVYKIIARKMTSLWLELLHIQTNSTTPLPPPPPSSPIFAQTPPPVVRRVTKNVEKLAHLMRINYSVYSEWYNPIILAEETKHSQQ